MTLKFFKADVFALFRSPMNLSNSSDLSAQQAFPAIHRANVNGSPVFLCQSSPRSYIYNLGHFRASFRASSPISMQAVKDSNPNLPILIVGTKSDLVELRKIPIEQAYTFVKGIYPGEIIEVSAKSGQNVENLFEILTRKIIAQSKKVPLIIPMIRSITG